MQELEIAYEVDFLILGLSCFEKDYRLCWMLNRELGFDFRRIDDLSISRKKVEQCFPLFFDYRDDERTAITLIKNRTTEGVLLPEMKHVDYLIKVEADALPEGMLTHLRSMSAVAGVFEIDPNSLKNLDLLVS